MSETKQKILYFITGASGVGKTTLVEKLRKKYSAMPWAFLHFDSIGVPPLKEMQAAYGSPNAWQEAKTYEWVKKLMGECAHDRIFLEGQVNFEFIQKAFAKHNFTSFKIILIDCNEDQMRNRLIEQRNQPELFNKDMKNWLRFLRSQAKALDAIIIDSSNLSVEQVVQRFEERVGL